MRHKKMIDARNALNKRVSNPRRKDSFRPHKTAILCDALIRPSGTVLINGEPRINLPGFYEKIIVDLQNRRVWERQTCIAYDRVFISVIVASFSDLAIEFADENDYSDRWDKILRAGFSDSQLDIACRLIRLLVDEAYRSGLSPVSLWGVIVPDYYPGNASGGKAAEQEQLISFSGIRVPNFIPLDAEFRVTRTLINYRDMYGEAVGMLIIHFTGTRPSEALGLSYSDLIEVAPGYWGLKRSIVLDEDGVSLILGAKSEAGFRLLPIPPFLAKILLSDRRQLEEKFGKDTVQSMPLAFCGNDRTKRADLAALRRVSKEVYRVCGVAEEMVANAMHDLRTEQEIANECEKSLVTYLGRKTMITSLEYLGLAKEEIKIIAGHAQDGIMVQPGDLSNADYFIKISDILNKRPITIALNSAFDSIWDISDPNVGFVSDTLGTIRLVESGDYEICVQPFESGQSVRLMAIDGVNILNCEKYELPLTGGRNKVNLSAAFQAIAKNTYNKIFAEPIVTLFAPPAYPVFGELRNTDNNDEDITTASEPDDLDSTEGAVPLIMLHNDNHTVLISDSITVDADSVTSNMVQNMAAPFAAFPINHPKTACEKTAGKPGTGSNNVSEGTPEILENIHEDPVTEFVPVPCKKNVLPTSAEMRHKPDIGWIAKTRNSETDLRGLYFLDSTHTLHTISLDKLVLKKRGLSGDKLCPEPLPRKAKAVRLYYHDAAFPYCAISRDGRICSVPPGIRLDQLCGNEKFAELRSILTDGGILLPFPEKSSDWYIAVLAADGSIAVTNNYNVSRAKKLVALSPENGTIVSAAFFRSRDNMFVLGSNNKIVHYSAGSFNIRTGVNVRTVKAMSIDPGQKAVCCMPEANPVLACYQDGYFARVGKTFREKSSARIGVSLSSHHSDLVWAQPYTGDIATSSVLGLLRSDGCILIIDPSEYYNDSKNSSSKCLRGITLSGGKVLTDAALLPKDLFN